MLLKISHARISIKNRDFKIVIFVLYIIFIVNTGVTLSILFSLDLQGLRLWQSPTYFWMDFCFHLKYDCGFAVFSHLQLHLSHGIHCINSACYFVHRKEIRPYLKRLMRNWSWHLVLSVTLSPKKYQAKERKRKCVENIQHYMYFRR